MADRVASSNPGGPTTRRPAGKRPAAGPPLKSKADKRAEAKAAKARARAAAKRRKVLLVVGAGVAAALVIVGVVLLINHESRSTKSASGGASASAGASAAAPSAAFPPLPTGADPALSTKPKVTAGTGTVAKLVVTTLIDGKGAPVAAGQTINVNYVGVTYKDGKEFDSSWSRSQAFSFQVGAGKVIPGWDQGLVGVKVGSRVQLDIPASLAYGDTPSNGAPAGTLRFVVDVLSAE